MERWVRIPHQPQPSKFGARRRRQYGDFDGLRVAGKSVTAKLLPVDCAVTRIRRPDFPLAGQPLR
jgi:hypothetical protein